MTTIHWKSAVGGDWSIAARWAGGVVPGTSDDAVIDPTGAYTVTLNSAEAVNSLSLDDAGATFTDDAVLTLGSSLTITKGEFNLDAGGVIAGGTLSATGGTFVWNGGTLSGVAYKGPLNVSSPLTIRDGLFLTGAGGAGPGVLNQTGGTLHVAAGESLDNATFNIDGELSVEAADNSDPNLTFGTNAHVNAKGGYILSGIDGQGIVNNGTISASVSGTQFTIDENQNTIGNLVNNGTMSVSNNSYLVTLRFDDITNNGTITLNGGALEFYGTEAIVNNGIINIVNGGGFEDLDNGAFANATGGIISVRGARSVAHLTGLGVSNAGAITISNGATAYIGTFVAAWSNTGTISVQSGATLHLNGQSNTTADLVAIVDQGGIIAIETELSNTGSVLTIGTGTADPVIDLNFGGSIVGGVIVDHGSGLRPEDGGLSGVTYDGLLNLSVAGTRLFVQGGLTINNLAGTGPGKINLTGEDSVLRCAGGETLDNATLDIGAAGLGAILSLETPPGSPQVLTFGSHFKIIQTGLTVFVRDSYGRAGDAIVNNGTIVADFAGGTFNISAASGGITPLRNFTNNGSIVVGNGEVMNLQPSLFSNLVSGTLTGGRYEVDAGSTIELKAGIQITTDVATIILDGAGSSIQALNGVTKAEVSLDSTLYQVAIGGTLEILGGRDWISTRAFSNAGTLDLGGGTFDVSHLTNTGVIKGYGMFATAVTNNSQITAAGGALEFQQLIAGPGRMTIDKGATLQADGAANAGVRITFAGAGGTLALGDAAVFAAAIETFVVGDTIDLKNTAATAATFAADRLTITDGGAAVATLRLIGTFAGESFNVASDGHGGTDITLAATPAPLAQAMAAMAPPPATSAAAPSFAQTAPPMLARTAG